MKEKRKPSMKVTFATGMGQYSEDCLKYLKRKHPELSFVPFDKELHDCSESIEKHVELYKEWGLSIPDSGYEFVSKEDALVCMYCGAANVGWYPDIGETFCNVCYKTDV